MNWIALAQDTNKRLSLINTAVNIWISQKAKNVGTGSSLSASENGFFPFSCFSRNGEENLCPASRNFSLEMSVGKNCQRTQPKCFMAKLEKKRGMPIFRSNSCVFTARHEDNWDVWRCKIFSSQCLLCILIGQSR